MGGCYFKISTTTDRPVNTAQFSHTLLWEMRSGCSKTEAGCVERRNANARRHRIPKHVKEGTWPEPSIVVGHSCQQRTAKSFSVPICCAVQTLARPPGTSAADGRRHLELNDVKPKSFSTSSTANYSAPRAPCNLFMFCLSFLLYSQSIDSAICSQVSFPIAC